MEIISGDESLYWISDHVYPSYIVTTILRPVNIPGVLRYKNPAKIEKEIYFIYLSSFLPIRKTLITPKFSHVLLIFFFVCSHLRILNTIPQISYLDTLVSIINIDAFSRGKVFSKAFSTKIDSQNCSDKTDLIGIRRHSSELVNMIHLFDLI